MQRHSLWMCVALVAIFSAGIWLCFVTFVSDICLQYLLFHSFVVLFLAGIWLCSVTFASGICWEDLMLVSRVAIFFLICMSMGKWILETGLYMCLSSLSMLCDLKKHTHS